MKDVVQQAILALKEGKPIAIFDAEGREEETDLVYASQFITAEDIQRLRKDAGGLICCTAGNEIKEKLELPYLADLFYVMGDDWDVLRALIPNDIPYDSKSSFSITINHRNTFTGITDKDRALTIKEFAGLWEIIKGMESNDAKELFGRRFRSPGHIPLLNSSKGGLKVRSGHTELSTAMVNMASLIPSATICEMMGDTGVARNKEEAKAYALENGLIFLEGYEVVEAWEEWSE